MAFNLGKKVVYKIIFIRIFLGLIIGIATFTIMSYYSEKDEGIMSAFGILFVLVGINLLLYLPVIKRNELEETLDATHLPKSQD